MTQLLLFDLQAPVLQAPVAPVASRAPRSEPTVEKRQPVTPVASGGIRIHDPQRGEIQRLGDLAQLIIARYELVAQRRRELRERQVARQASLASASASY